MEHKLIHERVVTDPIGTGGKPIIRGTQVPVHQVLERVAAGKTPEEILVELPELELADVRAALAYAAVAVRRQVIDPVSLVQRDDTLPASDGGGPANEPVKLDLNRILIVDDQEMNRLYMQSMFRNSEFTLSVASDGEEALTKARAELPFLILSDVQMPLMDGFELCRLLKADEQTKDAAVIFVTAHHRSSQKVVEGLDMGADDYIFRPFERRELLSRVKAVARIKRAEEEARRQAETVARRNRQVELLNELALAVASSSDLDEIFASSLQKLSQWLKAEALALLCFGAETQDLMVYVSSRTGERVAATVDFKLEGEVTEETIKKRVPPIIVGVLDDAGIDLEIDLASDSHSMTCFPMRSKEQIIGGIAVVNQREKSLAPEDRVLLTSAAGIVAVAVENTRLLQNVQQQVVDLILLNEIGHVLTSTLDLEQILHHTTQLVQESMQAEAASLWLLDETGRELVLTAASGQDTPHVVGFRVSVHNSIAGHVTQTGEPYFSAEVSADKGHDDLYADIDDAKARTILCVPVRVKDRIIGVVQALHQHSRWFDQNDLRLLYSVASLVGIAIENARLFGEVQAFNRRLERKVAERTRELAEEKEKTEAILASMADGLLVLDAEKRILTSNTVAEGMLDFRLSEVQGQAIGVERFGNPLWRRISELAAGAELTASASVDVPDPAQLGGVLSIQALAAPIRDESEKIIGTVVVLRDITAIKEVGRMKARFMTGITHELKTPLSIIRLNTNNLQAYHTRLSEQKRNELLNGIQTQSALLEQLVEDILALSRLDADVTRDERQPVDLSELTDEMMSDLLPLARRKQIALRWKKPATNLTVLAVRSQMKRLIQNLVDNAIKYTPTGGSVVLTLSSDRPNTVEIRVADTGIGIPREHQVRVFERFYRVDPSHTIPGTGLGLSIVKEIVTVYGGEIKLKSIPGKGSIFTVTLPGVEG
jgi:two-component system phosphate regulon sensor histidine kinase PhoR